MSKVNLEIVNIMLTTPMRSEYASYHTCLIFLLNVQYFKNQPFLKRRCTLERHAREAVRYTRLG